MKYLSLFSGIGGFELGINKAFQCETPIQSKGQMDVLRPTGDFSDCDSELGDGGRICPICVGYSEIDPYADAIYKYNFGGHGGNRICKEGQVPKQSDIQNDRNSTNTPKQRGQDRTERTNNHGGNYGDITKINPKELPDFDLLVGGFPCQAFSIAGKRKGFEDTRGTLIFDVLRILKEKQPRHFILENVKGLLSHDSGNTFKTIITSLAELGYAVEWQVLNAKNFGVPQNRERVFIVGHLGGFGGRQVFPIRESVEKDIINPLKGVSPYGWHFEQNVYDDAGIIRSLKSTEGSGNKPKVITNETNKYNREPSDPGCELLQGDVKSTKTIAHTIRTGGGRSMTKKHNWDSYPIDGKIRRLTPIECERLMGLPDNHTKYGLYGGEVKEMSDTRRYKACGNGVVSNVVAEVVRRLYADSPELADQKS